MQSTRPPLQHVSPAPATVAHAILDALAAHGIESLFGIPGGAISALYDASADRGVHIVTTRHETAAVFAAMGAARVTGRPAVALVTSGPGFTNALTGLAAAYAEELPVIVVAGDVSVASAGRFALQDGARLDVLSMARSITRYRARVDRPSAAASLIARATMEATGERPGPVLLTLPLDVSRARAAPARIELAPRSAAAAPDAACAEVARLLRSARRPLLIAGAGARGDRARRAMIALAERTGAMVTATAHAKGAFPERHRHYLGVLGFGGHDHVLTYARDADVTVVLGSRLSDLTTNGWSDDLRPSSALVQIDRDPAVLGRNYDVTLAVVADVAAATERIVAHTDELTVLPRGAALPDVVSGSGLVPSAVLAALDRALPDGAILSVDIGEHAAFAVHHLRVDSAERFHLNAGLGSMGSGLCGAIGIKAARPHAPVVAIVGDGGFAMHAGELLTCVRAGLGVVFVVLNDGRYRMCDLGFDAVYGRRPAGLPSEPADLAGIARACGAIGVRVDRVEQLDDLDAYLRSDRPAVLDVRVDGSEQLSVGTRTATIKHFSARR